MMLVKENLRSPIATEKQDASFISNKISRKTNQENPAESDAGSGSARKQKSSHVQKASTF